MKTSVYKPPTAEADFLVHCARVQLSEIDFHYLRELLKRPLDWERLRRLATRHSLLPLLRRHLQELSTDAIPAAVQESLQRYQRSLALRNLGFAGELVRLLRHFEEQRIPALPFKGPTLAQFAYGDVALREFEDLDILLRPGDVTRGHALLLEQGYRAPYPLTPVQERAYLRTQRQLSLQKPDGPLVELHAALALRGFAFDLDLADLWPRRCQVSLAGQPIAVPGAEDMLLILCMHGAKHLWKNLGWICDVAELLRIQPALDWDLVRREARRLRSERMVLLGVRLAEHVLQAPSPPELSGAARREPWLQFLLDCVLRRMLDDVEWQASGLESAAFHYLLREHPRDGLRFCTSLLLTPTMADWQTCPLPLSFAYYGLRPFRLVWKYLYGGDSTTSAV